MSCIKLVTGLLASVPRPVSQFLALTRPMSLYASRKSLMLSNSKGWVWFLILDVLSWHLFFGFCFFFGQVSICVFHKSKPSLFGVKNRYLWLGRAEGVCMCSFCSSPGCCLTKNGECKKKKINTFLTLLIFRSVFFFHYLDKVSLWVWA